MPKQFGSNLEQWQLGEIIKVAYHIDDEKLLKVCAKYLLENKKELNSIEEWKNFIKANNECMKQVGLYLILDDWNKECEL